MKISSEKHLTDDFPKKKASELFDVPSQAYLDAVSTPSETSAWEADFDKTFGGHYSGETEYIKAFIRATVAEAKRDVLREVVDVLEDLSLSIASDPADLCENSERSKSKTLKGLSRVIGHARSLGIELTNET